CLQVLVGSSVNGFGLDTSDADMCLIVSNSLIDRPAGLGTAHPHGSHAGLSADWCMNVPAKIPLVKLTNVRTGINCNNTVGLLNTRLLRAYADLDWELCCCRSRPC
ncbi:unnamed protein product, partial [Notodromas monacha]